jgi:hypothetical protein
LNNNNYINNNTPIGYDCYQYNANLFNKICIIVPTIGEITIIQINNVYA